MQKTTLKKIIEQYKKEIEQLIIEKSNLESKIQSLENNLDKITNELKKELDIFSKNSIDGFDIGAFIGNKVLNKITLRALQKTVGLLMMLFSVLLGLGMI